MRDYLTGYAVGSALGAGVATLVIVPASVFSGDGISHGEAIVLTAAAGLAVTVGLGLYFKRVLRDKKSSTS